MGHITANVFPAEVYAVLVSENTATCACCGHVSAREPVPIEDAARHVVRVTPGNNEVGVNIDRTISWPNVPSGVGGWGLCDYRGRLLFYDLVWPRVARGDTLTVNHEE